MARRFATATWRLYDVKRNFGSMSDKTMGIHAISVIPIQVEPIPNPRVTERPSLLPGLWLEGIHEGFADLAQQRSGQAIAGTEYAIVLDHPSYVQGLLGRLQKSETNFRVPDEWSQMPEDWKLLYSEHPLELDLEWDDIWKLVMMSCILGGASRFVVDRAMHVELKEHPDGATRQLHAWDHFAHVWQAPRGATSLIKNASIQRFPALDLGEVRGYSEVLERYFRATHWHSGRIAVALGAFLAYVLGSDPAQGYLALTTVFEALLSTGSTEVMHQISERLAFLLESDEDARYGVYKQMKRLYSTRSKIVHGSIENKSGVITTDRLRRDAKITVVPDQEFADIFDLCVRLFRTILKNEELLALLERRNSEALNEYYLRLGFRS